jgi:hypothetical protein
MKKLLLPIFLVVLLLANIPTFAQDVKQLLHGDWLYEIPDAGPGYDKGNLFFAEKDGDLICVVKLQGAEITASDLKVEGENISFITTVDGNSYKINLKLEHGKLTGTVDSSQGTVQMTAMKNNPFLGEWLYEIPEAGPGYDKGSLIFSDNEGTITCVVKLEGGEITISDLKLEGDTVSFSTAVESNSYQINLKLENEKLSGTVDTGQGTVQMTAIKKS